MWNNKLCMILTRYRFINDDDHMRLLKETGFDGFFTKFEDVDNYARLAKKYSMTYQSVHAPYNRARVIWHDEGEEGDRAVTDLTACLRACADNNVPISVFHAVVNFDIHNPTQIGLDRYGKIVQEAEKLGVKIAFENTEGEEYLEAVMKEFASSKAVGFCWDTGHEMCYNHSKDMLALYGDRILCTHLHDNLGISDFNGVIQPSDDFHLLPFDGIADWDHNMARLDKTGFEGMLTFELNLRFEGRFQTEAYFKMPFERYVAECYMRACRVAAKRKLSTKHI